MRLDQFKVGDKVFCAVGEGPADAYSTIRYIGPRFVVLAPSYDESSEFNVQTTDPHYDVFLRYESVDELKQRIKELEMLGFDFYAAIRDAAWTTKLQGPTPHMRGAMENWKAEMDRV